MQTPINSASPADVITVHLRHDAQPHVPAQSHVAQQNPPQRRISANVFTQTSPENTFASMAAALRASSHDSALTASVGCQTDVFFAGEKVALSSNSEFEQESRTRENMVHLNQDDKSRGASENYRSPQRVRPDTEQCEAGESLQSASRLRVEPNKSNSAEKSATQQLQPVAADSYLLATAPTQANTPQQPRACERLRMSMLGLTPKTSTACELKMPAARGSVLHSAARRGHASWTPLHAVICPSRATLQASCKKLAKRIEGIRTRKSISHALRHTHTNRRIRRSRQCRAEVRARLSEYDIGFAMGIETNNVKDIVRRSLGRGVSLDAGDAENGEVNGSSSSDRRSAGDRDDEGVEMQPPLSARTPEPEFALPERTDGQAQRLLGRAARGARKMSMKSAKPS